MLDSLIIKEKIGHFLRQPISKLQDEIVLTDLVAESFILVEMVIELQDELGVRLVQEDLKDIKTVGALVELLIRKATP